MTDLLGGGSAAVVKAQEPSMDRLILEIEVPGYNVEGIQAAADEFCDGDVSYIVTEELMRADVGLTFVSIPGEKCMNSDFEVHAMNGRIVSARILSPTQEPGQSPAAS